MPTRSPTGRSSYFICQLDVLPCAQPAYDAELKLMALIDRCHLSAQGLSIPTTGFYHRPHQVWATDITYISMAQGCEYLIAIIDWYSRTVLSWRVSKVLVRPHSIIGYLSPVEFAKQAV